MNDYYGLSRFKLIWEEVWQKYAPKYFLKNKEMGLRLLLNKLFFPVLSKGIVNLLLILVVFLHIDNECISSNFKFLG
jgi:hypothetical protein